MGRIFRGFLAIKAAVFGLLILVLWVRSHFVADAFHKGNQAQYIELGSAAGTVIARFGHDGNQTHLEGSWKHVRSEEPDTMLKEAKMEDGPWNKLGFGYNKTLITNPQPGVVVNVMLPHWLVFLLAIPSALRWLWKWSQKPKVYTGGRSWCPSCVREIRGVVAKCPGCGGPVAVEEAWK